jgi:Fe-Mn family superoxide dismutase
VFAENDVQEPFDKEEGKQYMSFTLSELPYATDALQPYMSAETFEFHHTKHHAAYVDNANKLIAGSEFEGKGLEEVITGSFGTNPGVFNNAAQHFNHDFFWKSMTPNGGGAIPGNLEAKINEDLGGIDKLKADFIQTGVTQFGSGWAWLVLKDGRLELMKTANAENPLVHGAEPLLVCDVWEHAYYIDYRNARPAFLETWINNLANWEHAAAMLETSQ